MNNYENLIISDSEVAVNTHINLDVVDEWKT